MHVQVKNFLAAVFVAIDDQAVAVVGDALVPRDSCRHSEQPSQGRFVLFPGIVRGGDFHFGNDQDVNRRLRGNIAKGQHEFVFIDNIGRDIFGDDLRENRTHVTPPVE